MTVGPSDQEIKISVARARERLTELLRHETDPNARAFFMGQLMLAEPWSLVLATIIRTRPAIDYCKVCVEILGIMAAQVLNMLEDVPPEFRLFFARQVQAEITDPSVELEFFPGKLDS